MTQQGSYSLQKTAFAFSLCSNAAAAATQPDQFIPAIQEKFAAMTAPPFQPYLGGPWTLDWGPAVFQDAHSTAADNALIAVKGADASGNPVYIVATAGTNPKSSFDIWVEDVEVGREVPFHGNAKIARGTSTGLSKIEGLTSKGTTLQQYLGSVPGRGTATLVFTGHSLGGALAPTLALDLFLNKGLKLADWGVVQVLPTAGPTPGYVNFAKLFRDTFPAKNGWNANIVNTLDVVPLAWTNLEGIGTVYQPNLQATGCIKSLVTLLQLRRGRAKYAQLPQITFPGTFTPQTIPSPFTNNLTCQYAAQAIYQHIAAYVQSLVPELLPLFSGLVSLADAYPKIAAKCPATS